MKFGHQRIASLASLFILSALAQELQAASVELPVPDEKVWAKALQMLALDGATITSSDRQSGVVQFAGSFAGKPDIFKCPKSGGLLVKETYSGTLVIVSIDDNSSSVTIQISGIETRYRNRHFLVFRTSRVNFDIQCSSTGKLEQAFIQRLSL